MKFSIETGERKDQVKETEAKLSGPDLAQGVDISQISDGAMLPGHANGEAILLARRGDELFAIGAICTHYGAPLVDGLLVGDTVRCPWHHACFSLRNGAPLRAPALDPVSCWRVEQRDGKAYVCEKLAHVESSRLAAANDKTLSMIIVGGGGAGNIAAETLRREGFSGRIILLSADASGPCDRPNLSKGFLAGTSAAESNPLRPPAFYREHGIEPQLDAPVAPLDTQGELADDGAGMDVVDAGEPHQRVADRCRRDPELSRQGGARQR